MRVLAAIIALPLIEIAGFVYVGERIGALATMALTVCTAVGGLWLVRLEGIALVGRFAVSAARGETPAVEAVEGLALAAAGLLLLIPGFVSDLLGALLLIRPLRAAAARRLTERLGAARPRGAVIDGEFRRIAPDAQLGEEQDDRR